MPRRAERLASAAAVIIVTAHTGVDYGLIAEHARLVIDTRNALAGRSGAARVVKL
jgi:UDP-N-acetyl-D-glucosamine dehydrogenase